MLVEAYIPRIHQYFVNCSISKFIYIIFMSRRRFLILIEFERSVVESSYTTITP